MKRLRRSPNGGFTLVELMIVIAILGILAAVAILNFNSFRVRSYNALANGDVGNAYRACLAHYINEPEMDATVPLIEAVGFRKSLGVVLEITDGTMENLTIISQHEKGSRIFTANFKGEITITEK